METVLTSDDLSKMHRFDGEELRVFSTHLRFAFQEAQFPVRVRWVPRDPLKKKEKTS